MLEIPEGSQCSQMTGAGLQGSIKLQFLSRLELKHFSVQQFVPECLLFAVENGEEIRGIEGGNGFEFIKFNYYWRCPATCIRIDTWLRVKGDFYYSWFWSTGASREQK